MKRLLVILFLIPSLAFGAFTEFYCQSGGSNVNAGSTNNNTPIYQKAHGNWTQATGIFTVQDGTNPSSSVTLGDWCAVMVDGGTVAAWIARVTAVQNANNGTITVNTNGMGSKPANQTATATITDGGAWLGPNGASGFPFTVGNLGITKDSSSHLVRINMKNDQTYSVTAVFAPDQTQNTSPCIIQGYTSSTGDGGKANIDGGTSTAAIMSATGPAHTSWIDLIFSTSITSGATTLVTTNTQPAHMLRCVFHGARANGFSTTAAGTTVTECEAYDNDKNNSVNGAGFTCSNQTIYNRCISHDNSTGNASGFYSTFSGVSYLNCISDTNGLYGIEINSTTNNGRTVISNGDVYNNASDGINIVTGNVSPIWIENTNLIKNGGSGINNVSTTNTGFVYNCGEAAAGTTANGSADTLNNLSVDPNPATYAANTTPWVDPANGDFRINLATAEGAGRGAFTQTAASYTGSVGYPDIGAVQAQIGTAFPTPTATPSATATATATPTATATVTPTVTPTPTAPIEQSYVYPN